MWQINNNLSHLCLIIYDLAVTMNMLRSDNNRFLEKYAYCESGKKEMISTMAIEYLQDPDAPHPTNKIWC